MNAYKIAPISCSICLDSGLCYAVAKDEGVRVFIRCSCKRGTTSTFKELPQWNIYFSEEYEQQNLNPSDWVPEKFSVVQMIKALEEKRKIAKQFWENNRGGKIGGV